LAIATVSFPFVALAALEGSGCGSPPAPLGTPFSPVDGGPTIVAPDGAIIPVTSDGSLTGVVVGDDGGGGSTDCPAGAGKYIYVVSDQNDLYTFDPTLVPAATAFTKLGPLKCPGETTPPTSDSEGVNSMAVDRQAIAWVNFNDGKIFKVDTTKANLPCTDTGFVPGQGNFTPQLGMGFVTNSATDHTERLFVSDNNGPGGNGVPDGGLGLGVIDTSTMMMTPTGGWGSPLGGYNAELSGTGGGVLYGFFTTTPSSVAQIDKANAAVSGVIPLGTVMNSQGGYAFSFWGGDFWIYTAFPPAQFSSVTHYVSADGGVGVVMPQLTFTIVGAGSSTCVPIVPPPPAK
jgi:hypothetical protein